MDSIEQILETELAALRLIVPELNLEKHKGQAGILARQIFMLSSVKVETTAGSMHAYIQKQQSMLAKFLRLSL